MIYSAAEGKLNVKSEEMPPVPKRSRISGTYCFGGRDQDSWNKDQCDSRVGNTKRYKHDFQRLLRLCTYYRNFINEFADIAASLHNLTDMKSPFSSTAKCEAAFKRLKNECTML